MNGTDAEIRELGRQAGDGDVEAAERLLLTLRRRAEAPAGGPFVDMFGHAIKPGCLILYPVMKGQSTALSVAKVVATRMAKHAWKQGDENPRMTVVGVEDHWKEGPKLKNKGTLHFPDKTLVIDPWTVPKKYMDLLDGVVAEPDGKQVGKAKTKGGAGQ